MAGERYEMKRLKTDLSSLCKIVAQIFGGAPSWYIRT